jgi:hypothetical protein
MAKSAVHWINKIFDFRNLLKSRIILYLFFFAALIQLFVFSMSGEYLVVAFFLLTGFLISFFSKNMIVILCLALVISNIFKYGVAGESMEGFSGNDDIVERPRSNSDTSIKDLSVAKNSSLKDSVVTKDTSLKDSVVTKDTSLKDSVTIKPTIDSKSDDTTDLSKLAAELKSKIPEGDKESQLEYKNLLELQLKLIDGISNIKPVLNEVVDKIEKLKRQEAK